MCPKNTQTFFKVPKRVNKNKNERKTLVLLEVLGIVGGVCAHWAICPASELLSAKEKTVVGEKVRIKDISLFLFVLAALPCGDFALLGLLRHL